jgi:hypothetical protein
VTRREAIRLGGVAALASVAGGAPASAITLDDLRRLEREAVAASIAAEQTATVALEALANGGALDDRTAGTVRILLDHAKEHVDMLAQAFKQSLGEDPPLAPNRTAIPGLAAVHSRVDALRLAERLEQRAIAAHQHAVTRTKKLEILKAIAGTVGSDAQGLVLLRQLLGQPPAPSAFERGAA